MRCPVCGGDNCKCIDTRASKDGRRRRRYRCRDCKSRFTTRELYDFEASDPGRLAQLTEVLRRVKEAAERAL